MRVVERDGTNTTTVVPDTTDGPMTAFACFWGILADNPIVGVRVPAVKAFF